eukprot:jgi/Botrbrau1/19637/Bobra.0003s0007.1
MIAYRASLNQGRLETGLFGKIYNSESRDGSTPHDEAHGRPGMRRNLHTGIQATRVDSKDIASAAATQVTYLWNVGVNWLSTCHGPVTLRP